MTGSLNAPMGPEPPVAPTGAVGPEAAESASAVPCPLQSAPSPAFLWGDWVWHGSEPPRPLGRFTLEADGRLCVTVDDDRYSGKLSAGTAFDLALAILELRQERIELLTAQDFAAMAASGRCALDGKKLDRRPARSAGHFEWVCPCGLTVSE